MKARALTISCKKCGAELYRYQKIGSGKVIVCWKGRIIKDTTITKDHNVYCRCGAQIGIDQKVRIKIRQNDVIIR